MSQAQTEDKVLLDAWAELAVYDGTASDLKKKFINRRYQVIGFSLIATIASVATALLQNETIAYVVAGFAIALPLIAAFLMEDTIKFTGTSSWIKYRFIAEMMRMHIYLYRMGAGVYFDVPPQDANNVLGQKISEMKTIIDMNNVIPKKVSRPKTVEETKQAIVRANYYTGDQLAWEKIDDADEYLNVRLRSSRDWYDAKIEKDFTSLKRNTRWSQVVLLIGALGTALAGILGSAIAGFDELNIQIVSLVAITNALSAYFITRSNIAMTGKTYSLFQIASEKLGDLNIRWNGMADDEYMQTPETAKEPIANFVLEVENILLWEREEWYEMALQSQQAVDQIIIGDLDRLKQRADNAQEQTNSPGDGNNTA